MRFGSKCAAATLLLLSPLAAHAQQTDWGGGYHTGADSASTTAATSGAGVKTPAAVAPPPAPVSMQVPLTDWGGGYLRGPDSASTTVATSGAGTPKPKN